MLVMDKEVSVMIELSKDCNGKIMWLGSKVF